MLPVLKQTFWLILAQILTRILGFFYTIFLARNLGVADFGLYSVALAYFSLVSSVADLGFNRFLIREISNDHKKIAELLFSSSLLRLTITSVLFSFFALILYILDPEKLRVSLILLAILAVIPQGISFTIDAIFVALKKLQFSSLGLITLSIATLISGVILVKGGLGPIGALIALIIGQLVYLFVLVILFQLQKLKVQIDIKYSAVKQIIRQSFPYGILGILGLLYFRVDILLISYLKGNFDAGIYGAAYRFLEAVVFIPASFALAILPISIKKISANPQSIYKLYKKSMSLLFLIAIPLTFAYWFVLPFFIKQFLPQYFNSISVLSILASTIPFMFMISVQGAILFSSKKFLKALLIMSVFNLSFNVLINLYLIQNYTYFGAAWATLISDIVGFCLFFIYIRSNFLNLK